VHPSDTSLELKKSRPSSRPNAFQIRVPFGKKRSTSCDTSSNSDSPRKPTNPIDHNEDSPANHKRLSKRDSESSKTKEPISLYQLWRELCGAEQKILHNSDLTEFIEYLTKKDSTNYSESIRFVPPDDKIEEYNLMARIKIDSQFEFICELFKLKKNKLLQDQPNQDKKQLEDLFKTFEKYYIKQIDIAKKYSKPKS
jgi:hypothetical protein